MSKCPEELIFNHSKNLGNDTLPSLEVPEFELSTGTKGPVILFYFATIITSKMHLKAESKEGG